MISFWIGFQLLQAQLGDWGFYGAGCPQCIITDDSDAERGALAEVWPHCASFSVYSVSSTLCGGGCVPLRAPSHRSTASPLFWCSRTWFTLLVRRSLTGCGVTTTRVHSLLPTNKPLGKYVYQK